jgi:hypothetical protein
MNDASFWATNIMLIIVAFIITLYFATNRPPR